MSHDKEPTDETTKYFFARYLVAHIVETLQQSRWRDKRDNSILYDLGQVMIAIEHGYVDYRSGPNFHDHIMTASDLTPATIDGTPHLVVKHHHIDADRIRPAVMDYLKTSFREPVEVTHGFARTVYVSKPIETLRWATKDYTGSKFKITSYMLKGTCFNATC